MGQVKVVCAVSADFATSTRTGPGRPVEAMWKAWATARGISAGSVTRKLCLVIGIVMPRMSASWNASVPIIEAPTWPVIATRGTESMCASASGVTRFVAPGPEVAMQTPTRPLAAAYPCAAWPAPCSWRTRMWRIEESIIGSYAGRIAPPGIPNTCSVPAASSERIRLCAPVIVPDVVVVLCWVMSGPFSGLVLATKNPSVARATRGDALAV
ncbi:hypothetical protein NOCARDAX2BIS_370036 [Nocardioides sp. AX2bis]|nr:hypothetical protein NOCARDAX2BIS_370036 [Nocardioides sp. AX2bis]